MNAEAQYFQYLAQSAGTDSRVRRYPAESAIVNNEEYPRVSSHISSERRRQTSEFTDWDFLSEWERSTQPKKGILGFRNETSENLASNQRKPISECGTHPHKSTQEIDPQHKKSRMNNRMFQKYVIPASILIGALIFSILSHPFLSVAENFVKNVLEAFLVLFVFHPDQLCALIEILFGHFRRLENFPQF
ncbi:uncharacterized protein Bfra_002711 [Botrytis fragariae]|uniref:Uncharacterized protein n=1 Tax=Botrytis fragariae TaxID=1964551 RepID=A0A8H6AZF3_9HELO|nr:uncharacterized protein Bfra_002711 [Botrytis fragariae]KAF5876307.1 hypothetical protein Bfra_002711 [Botrytis fragariae]